MADGGICFSEEEVIEEFATYQPAGGRRKMKMLISRAGEIEIVQLIEKEYNNRQNCRSLVISGRTVETLTEKTFFRKTNANSVIGLVKCMRMNIG